MRFAQELVTKEEIIAHYMDEIGTSVATCVTAAAVAVAVMCLMKSAANARQRPGQPWAATNLELFNLMCVGLAAMLVVAATLTGFAYRQVGLAMKHGMYDTDMSVREIVRANRFTPEESALPDDVRSLSDVTVVYYRYGCPDCEAVFPELQSALDATGEPYYWVSTRSEAGRELLKQYVVNDVPSILYIYPGGRGHAVLSCHEKDPGTGETVMPGDVMEYLDEIKLKARSEPVVPDLNLDEVAKRDETESAGHGGDDEAQEQPAVTLIWALLDPDDVRLALVEP